MVLLTKVSDFINLNEITKNINNYDYNFDGDYETAIIDIIVDGNNGIYVYQKFASIFNITIDSNSEFYIDDFLEIENKLNNILAAATKNLNFNLYFASNDNGDYCLYISKNDTNIDNETNNIKLLDNIEFINFFITKKGNVTLADIENFGYTKVEYEIFKKLDNIDYLEILNILKNSKNAEITNLILKELNKN